MVPVPIIVPPRAATSSMTLPISAGTSFTSGKPFRAFALVQAERCGKFCQTRHVQGDRGRPYLDFRRARAKPPCEARRRCCPIHQARFAWVFPSGKGPSVHSPVCAEARPSTTLRGQEGFPGKESPDGGRESSGAVGALAPRRRQPIRGSIPPHKSTENQMYIGGGILGTLLVVLLIVYVARRV